MFEGRQCGHDQHLQEPRMRIPQPSRSLTYVLEPHTYATGPYDETASGHRSSSCSEWGPTCR